ncbi:MAG TPA: hypothetical protein VFR85_04240 [Anaeromyxobacteraceae bacterium]|nr:hypothetical protein [Anaeromyxobacteraceae bacterium]
MDRRHPSSRPRAIAVAAILDAPAAALMAGLLLLAAAAAAFLR